VASWGILILSGSGNKYAQCQGRGVGDFNFGVSPILPLIGTTTVEISVHADGITVLQGACRTFSLFKQASGFWDARLYPNDWCSGASTVRYSIACGSIIDSS